MKKAITLLVSLALVLSLSACNNSTAEELTESYKTELTNTQTPSELPPAEILESNINSTDVTLAFEITDTDFIEQNELYATFQITGKVTKVIKGDFSSNDTIVFYKTIEGNENSKPYLSNEVFASFTLDENANLQIPDIGYEFNYSDELKNLVSEKMVVEEDTIKDK